MEDLNSLHHVGQTGHRMGQEHMAAWQKLLEKSPLEMDQDFLDSIEYYFPGDSTLKSNLIKIGESVPALEAACIENDQRSNLPRLERYDGIGRRVEKIVHHPSYEDAGNYIYGTGMMAEMARSGGLLKSLASFFLTSHAGEAGHNCPVACTAGIIRVLNKVPDFNGKERFLEKLLTPSFTENFTGAQFLTEIQGGSDVGLNATLAYQDAHGNWRIKGEKWFCSNANADLILMTARYDENTEGTRGLGLFLIPRILEDGSLNQYMVRRLKEKLGTRSMASGEIDFRDAHAIPMGEPKEGFKMVMENVLHLSRIYNTFAVVGMVNRALQIATSYAMHRQAFGHKIINYPLVQENLAIIRAESRAVLAAGMAAAHFQDLVDLGKIENTKETQILNRALANLNKYSSALWSVDHIHHCIDMLAGNGAIESFSTLPRLFRDSIVCENWEGTHNTLRMQILRDMLRYQQDQILIQYFRKELKNLTPSKAIESIADAVRGLEADCKSVKDAKPALQSLLIKGIVDQMASINAAICLAQEADHQRSACGRDSKDRQLELFIELRLQKVPAQPDENYLKLIADIAG